MYCHNNDNSTKIVGNVNVNDGVVQNCNYYLDLGLTVGCTKCEHGYHGVSLDSVNGCAVYKDNQYTCQQCIENYYLASQYECKAVVDVQYCLRYNTQESETICLECENDFYVESSKVCRQRVVSMNKPFCLAQTHADLCDCLPGYFNKGQNGQIDCASKPNFCITPITEITCLVCDDSVSYKSQNQTCLHGGRSNCIKYQEDADFCIKCDNGFVLENGSCIAHDHIYGCESYNPETKNKCDKCSKTEVLFEVQNQCVLANNIDYCEVYNTVTTCKICEDGYKLSNIGKTCIEIQEEDHCVKQVPIDINNDGNFSLLDTPDDFDFIYTCIQCEVGYFMVEYDLTFFSTTGNPHPQNGEVFSYYVCVQYHKPLLSNCESNNVSGSIEFDTPAKCEICSSNYYPESFANDYYICLDYIYVQYQLEQNQNILNPDHNCTQFSYQNTAPIQNEPDFKYICEECKFPYVLEPGNEFPEVCVPCDYQSDQFIQIYTYKFDGNRIVSDSSDVNNIWTCNDPAVAYEDCKVVTGNLYVDDLLYACAQCQEGRLTLLTYTQGSSGDIPVFLDPENQINKINFPLQQFNSVTCQLYDDATNFINGNTQGIGNEAKIMNCARYQEFIADQSDNKMQYGCVVCENGYSGIVQTVSIDDGGGAQDFYYIEECSPIPLCDSNSLLNDPMYRGQGVFIHDTEYGIMSKFYSCFSCTDDNGNSGYVPTLFAQLDANLKPIGFETYYPAEYLASLNIATDAVNDTKGAAVECIKWYTDDTLKTFETEANILAESNLVVANFPANNALPNCQLFIVNTSGGGDLTNLINDDNSGDVYCSYCAPNFKAVRATIPEKIIECEEILYCDNSDNALNTWMNACQNCVHYINYELTSKEKIQFDRCVEPRLLDGVDPTICYAARDVGTCLVCQKGYTKNDMDICEQVQVPYCTETNYENNFRALEQLDLLTDGDNPVEDIQTRLFTIYFQNAENINGCTVCEEIDPNNGQSIRTVKTKINSQISKQDPLLDTRVCTQNYSFFEMNTDVQNCERWGYDENEEEVICKECEANYVLTVDNDCTVNNVDNFLDNCQIAFKMGGTSCKVCKENYLNIGGTCELIDPGVSPLEFCLEYDMQGSETSSFPICDTCMSGYHKKGTQCVQNEDPYCAQYHVNLKICVKCKQNSVLIENQNGHFHCFPNYHVQNMKYCEVMVNNICNQCVDVELSANGVIQKCLPIGMQQDPACKTFNMVPECTECKEGYQEVQDNGVIKACIEIVDDVDNLDQCLEWDEMKFQEKKLKCNICAKQYLIETNMMRESKCMTFFQKNETIQHEICAEFDLEEPENVDPQNRFQNQSFRCKSCIPEENVNNEEDFNYHSVYYFDQNISQCIQRSNVQNCQKNYEFKDDCDVCLPNFSKKIIPNQLSECNRIKPLPDDLPLNLGYIQKCSPMEWCESNKQDGLKLQIASLVSCHVCTKTSEIPFIGIRINQNTDKIESLQQFGIPNDGIQKFNEFQDGLSTQCFSPTDVTFGLDENTTFMFPANCGVGIFNVSSNKESPNSSDPIQNLQNGSGIFCGGCKPGYKASYATSAITNNEFDFLVFHCDQIANCEGSEWFNYCSQCDVDYLFKYVKGEGVKYDECIHLPTNNNCFAAYNEGGDYLCKFCKKGYLLNPDGICEQFKSPRCGHGEFRFRENYSLFDLGTGLILSDKGVGCYKCDPLFSGLYTHNENNYACTESLYHSSTDFNANSKYIFNCKHYKMINKDRRECFECRTGNVLTLLGDCVVDTNIKNCKSAMNDNHCVECNEGFVTIDRKCVAVVNTSCAKFANNDQSHQEECIRCKEGYYMQNNDCLEGSIDNCMEYLDSETCIKCYQNFNVVNSKEGSFCYPEQTDSTCLKMNQQVLTYGIYDCKQCRDNSFILQTDKSKFITSICVDFIKTQKCFKYDKSNLISFSNFKCIECLSDYYLTPEKLCILRTIKDLNCIKYSKEQDICMQCSPDYYLSGDSFSCLEFPKGIPNCESYGTGMTCEICKPGFFLKEQECLVVPDDKKIDGCKVYGDNICEICENNFTVQDGICVATKALNCLTYESIHACASCPIDFGFKVENNLKNCVAKVVPNCFESSNYEPYECYECSSQFYLKESTCESVTTQIENCQEYSENGVCSRCVATAALSEDFLTCLSTVEILSQLDGNCSDSKLQTNPVCNTCKEGYFFSHGFCTTCQTQQFEDGCMNCDPQNQEICLACRSEFYMWEDGICRGNGEEPPIPVEEDENKDNNDNGNNPPSEPNDGDQIDDGFGILVIAFKYWLLLFFLN